MTNPVAQSAVSIKWEAWDGRVWDIMRGTEGAVLTAGISSLLLPDFTPRMQKTARAPGARFRGIDWAEGTAQLNVTVGDTWITRPDGNFRRGDMWLSLDADFRAAFHPVKPGSLIVDTTRFGPRRFVGRLTDLEAEDTGTMPDIRGRASYSISLMAELPFFQGDSTVLDFPYVAGNTVNYYGVNNLAPDFVISQGNTLNNVLVFNPSDIDTWPTWILTGPGQPIIGVGEHITYVPPLAAGEQLTIVTNPHGMSVTDTLGDRAWHRLEQYDFGAIPAGDQVPITAQIIGGGPGANIRVELPAWYFAAM